MMDSAYFGTYARYETASKKDAAVLLGADSVVGDFFEIEFRVENGLSTAWMVNRFEVAVGCFDAETSHQLSLCAAKDWNLIAILSFVAFTEHPEPGYYWGEAAVIAYDPKESDIMTPFLNRLAKKVSEGIRVDLDLGQQAFKLLRAEPETWLPTGRVKLPEQKPGTVYLKRRKKMSENIIEQGRRGNIGCYIGSWIFILAVVAAVIFGLKSCGVF